jgi:hypothetical protein
LPEFATSVERAFLLRGPERALALTALTRQLTEAADARPYLQILLDRCVAYRSEDGLELATTVLTQSGNLALMFAQDFLTQDRARWAKDKDTRYHPCDDIWTVLIRAACRQEGLKDESLALLRQCLLARNRGLREAVVDGLHDLATPGARDLLATLTDDLDPLVARLAREALGDIEEP